MVVPATYDVMTIRKRVSGDESTVHCQVFFAIDRDPSFTEPSSVVGIDFFDSPGWEGLIGARAR